MFFKMLSKCQAIAPTHKFRFKNKLYSLDVTTIDLCLSLYDWAKFRTTKGAVKLHVKLNHAGYLPNFAVITDGSVREAKSVTSIPLERNDVVVLTEATQAFHGIKLSSIKEYILSPVLRKMLLTRLLSVDQPQNTRISILIKPSN